MGKQETKIKHEGVFLFRMGKEAKEKAELKAKSENRSLNSHLLHLVQKDLKSK